MEKTFSPSFLFTGGEADFPLDPILSLYHQCLLSYFWEQLSFLVFEVMKLSFKMVQIFEKKTLFQNFTSKGTYKARQTLFCS